MSQTPLSQANGGVRFVITALVILFFFAGVSRAARNHLMANISPSEAGDYLIYQTRDYSGIGRLMHYDPFHDTHTPILTDWRIHRISLSADGRLAFSALQANSIDTYLLNYPFTEEPPIKIIENVRAEIHPMAWSRDGQYLAYKSMQEREQTLLVWDGEASSIIYESEAHISQIGWGPNNELTFTEFYFSSLDGIRDEIYFWDGHTTTSLSQNPSGTDRNPVWSPDGRLAFLSERDGSYGVYIWDGASKINGRPDPASFQEIAPDLTGYFSLPEWTESGLLTFSGIARGKDRYIQVYAWNGATAVNISRNPHFHTGGVQRGDGYWAFSTYFYSWPLLLTIRDNKNRTIHIIREAQYPVWSKRGYLIFCVQRPHLGQWALDLWDGRQIIEITHGAVIDAVWQHGKTIHCSSG